MVTLVIQMNLVTIVEHGKTGNCDESGDSRLVILVFINLVNLWFDIKIYDLMFKCKKQIY